MAGAGGRGAGGPDPEAVLKNVEGYLHIEWVLVGFIGRFGRLINVKVPKGSEDGFHLIKPNITLLKPY